MPPTEPKGSPPTPESYKLLGNRLLSQNNLISAEAAYSAGLLISSQHTSLLLNRSLARLRLHRPRLALEDASAALSFATQAAVREKALYRAASARYALGLWTDAKETFLRLPPSSPERALGVARCEKRLREVETGEFDWLGMYVASQGTPRLDVADYVSTAIRVEAREGRGRGLVVNRDVEAGTLLMCVRPFASVYASNLEAGEDKMTPTEIDLTPAVIRRIEDDPASARAVELLYAGPDPDGTSTPPPMFELEALLPVSNAPSEEKSAEALRNLDPKRIAAIISYNSFSNKRLGPPLEPSPDAPPSPFLAHLAPSGLYILPALVNHECIGNTTWTFFGDAMCLRSRCPLRAGDEVTQSYAGGMTVEQRAPILRKHLGAGRECGCELCAEDRLDSPEARRARARLVQELEGGEFQEMPTRGSLASVRRILRETEQTFAESRKEGMRFDLWPAWHLLADQLSFFASGGEREGDKPVDRVIAREAIQAEIQALKCCGVEMTAESADSVLPILMAPLAREEACVGSCLVIASIHHNLGEKSQVKRWMTAARWIDSIIVGGGEQLFELRYRDILAVYELEG